MGGKRFFIEVNLVIGKSSLIELLVIFCCVVNFTWYGLAINKQFCLVKILCMINILAFVS